MPSSSSEPLVVSYAEPGLWKTLMRASGSYGRACGRAHPCACEWISLGLVDVSPMRTVRSAVVGVRRCLLTTNHLVPWRGGVRGLSWYSSPRLLRTKDICIYP